MLLCCLLALSLKTTSSLATTKYEEGSSLALPSHLFQHYNKQLWLQRATLNLTTASSQVEQHARQLRALASLSLPSTLLNIPQTTPFSQYLIQMKMPITNSAKDLFHQHMTPYRLGQYLPHNSFLVVGPNDSEFLAKLSSAPAVLHASSYHAEFKISSSLERHATLLSLRPSPSDSPVTLLVHIDEAYYKSIQQLQSALSVWAEQLLKEAGLSVELQAKLPYLGVAIVPESKLGTVVAFLSHRHEVSWVERKPVFKSQNKFAKFVIQSNRFNLTDIWAQGIQGDGQVVMIADTGIDYDSCYFHDPARAVPVGKVDNTHRKIVLYDTQFGDTRDDIAGHGSHVSGTVLGEALSGNATTQAEMGEYNGMAPKAKLAFYDLKKSFEKDLNVPEAIYSTVFENAYKSVEARIASMSWGSDDGEYSHYCREIDKFLFDHNEFSTVFAAGNYGERGHFSISTPGISKNPLTVGACKSSSESFFDLGQQAGFKIVTPAALAGSYQVSPANFGVPFKSIKLAPGTLVETAHPPDACAPLLNRNAAGKVILVQRGLCFFTVKAQNVRMAGGVLMMLVNADNGPSEVMGGEATGDDANFTSVMISKVLGDHMWPYAEKQGLVTKDEECRIEAPVEFNSEELTENNMAGFSSMGPTKDMRLKPDVVAPGMFIVSVNSDSDPNSFKCNKKDSLVSMEGTSMATPVVAGAMALAREYFERGFYPSGSPNLKDGFSATGALLKAIMVASATSVGGVVHLQTPGRPARQVRPAPSSDQGYGRVLLDAILYFNNSALNSSFRLYVNQEGLMNNLGLSSFCFRVSPEASSGGGETNSLPPFRATLAWMDPPSTPAAALQMINDLDLFVTVPNSSSLFLGNNLSFVDSAGVVHRFWDSNTNVERVSLSAADIGEARIFAVHVRGTHVPQEVQPFALVVNGNIELVDISLCKSALVCPANCWANLSHGTCTEFGTCKCNGDYYGSECGQQAAVLARDPENLKYWRGQGRSKVLTWDQYIVEVTAEHVQDGWGLEVIMDVSPDSKGDPDVYVTFESAGLPSLSNFQYAGLACEPCGQKTAVTIPSDALQVGRYRIGVFGYCCEEATYTLTVTKPARIQRILNYLVIGGFVLVAVCLIACGAWLYVRCRKHRAGFSEVGVAQESLELVSTDPHEGEDEDEELVVFNEGEDEGDL